MDFSVDDLLKEVSFRASRSGGKGGQHVNKVSSRVELLFDVQGSLFLSDQQKQMIVEKLSGRINTEGILRVVADSDRSQIVNRGIAAEKLFQLLSSALHVQKARKPARRTKSSVEKRLKLKKEQALKKINRRGDWQN